MDSYTLGQPVRLLIALPSYEAGSLGTVADTASGPGVVFDGFTRAVIAYEGRSILDYCEPVEDDRLVQLSFDWWLNFGDWSGQRESGDV